MVKIEHSEVIQAFPIHEETFIGIADNYIPEGKTILHTIEDDTNITFTFLGAGSKTLKVHKYMDLAISDNCVAITTDKEVWIS